MEAARPRPNFRFDTPPHIVIVEARFYADIADLQLQGVRAVLKQVNGTYDVITVPGALEIPAAISFAAELSVRADGYIALGCVLKGGTMHDEIVATESARGLQDLAMSRSLPIGNGILTCNTMDQAMERADPLRLNRSGEAAEACLRMIELKNELRLRRSRQP